MIEAIGIYTFDDSSRTFKKVIFAQQEKSISKLFAPVDQLEDLEKISLADFSPEEHLGLITHAQVKEYHHYLFQPKDQNFVIACSSRKKLDNRELHYLMTNIGHVYLRPKLVKNTLDDIITNPLGFTGRDLLISSIEDKLKQVHTEMLGVIEKALEREDRLDSLVLKTDEIVLRTGLFKKNTKELNSCCRL